MGKAPLFFKEVETLFFWVRLLLFFKEVETLFLWVRLLLFCFKIGGDLVLVGKAPFYYSKRWRPCSCG